MSEFALQIRQATITDAPLLAEHRVSMFRDMGSAQPQIEGALRDAAAKEIREAMERDEYVAWLAYPAGNSQRIVAGAGVQLRRLLPRPETDGSRVLVGREGIVLNMYVDREYRRQGVAKRLMETIIAWAPRASIVRLVLHASVEGRPLYERMGFAPTNEMRYTRTLRPDG